MSIETLTASMKEAVLKMKQWPSGNITLLHHNDTDGLTSGTILHTALTEEGFSVRRFSLEKPYPVVLEKIFRKEGEIVIFADFAGKIAPLIASLNRKRNLVLIIDHHPAEYSDDDTVLNLDGSLHSLKGDRDISASATCFLFAMQLNPDNKSLAHLGALGAVGDGFLVEGKLSSVNRDCLLKAVSAGSMRFEDTDTGEEYFIRLGDTEYPAKEVCRALDTLGGVGYYSGGTDYGIQVCSRGFSGDIESEVEKLQKIQKDIFDREIGRLKNGGIHTTEHLQWFNVEERFSPMGVKMIGVFCNIIKNMDFLDHSRYIAGFQTVKNEIPGFGEIHFNSAKISMRVSDRLTERIRMGKSPGLSSFLPAATLALGGFADACHSLSAATTVELGKEEDLINKIEELLSKE